MKSSFLRAGLALLCAVILSACGGNSGNLQLYVTISYVGPAKTGLVVINNGNGEKFTPDVGVGGFYFTKLMGNDEAFDIGIATQPAGANCVVTNGKNKANVYTVYNTVLITCTATPFPLGGTVKGLKGTGLVLANGADTIAVAAPSTAGADATFTFPVQVPNGALYGATVLTQPTGQACAFDKALNPGTMPNAEQKSLIVNCTNN